MAWKPTPSTTTSKKIFSDNELQANAVIRDFRITAADGKTYNTQHYNLAAAMSDHFVDVNKMVYKSSRRLDYPPLTGFTH
jgi:hypothetical protein